MPVGLPELTELSPERTMCEGWLLKEGGVLRTVWQRRWCVLQPEGIYYFRDRIRGEVAAGLIPINGASVRLLPSDFHFEVSTARRSYLFRVDREPPPVFPAEGRMPGSRDPFGFTEVAFGAGVNHKDEDDHKEVLLRLQGTGQGPLWMAASVS